MNRRINYFLRTLINTLLGCRLTLAIQVAIICLACVERLHGDESIPSLEVGREVDGPSVRTTWMKSMMARLPDLEWKSITANGNFSKANVLVDNVVLLSGRDALDIDWLIAINSLPWTEHFDCRWTLTPPDATSLDETIQPDATSKTFQGMSSEAIEKIAFNVVGDQAGSGWRFEVPAMSIAVWSWHRDGTNPPQIAEWSHQASHEATKSMSEKISSINETIQRMTSFRTDFGLQMDGGFEAIDSRPASAHRNKESSWLFSMNPTAAWTVDRNSVRTGNASLQYQSDLVRGSGWVQTKEIPRRFSWPIAIEVWIRMEEEKNQPSVTLVTTRTTPTSRNSANKTIAAAVETDEAASVWKRHEFPLLSDATVEPRNPNINTKELLQWTIEVNGSGRLWVDDVGFCPLALTEEERRLLRSQLFIAKRELELGRPVKALEWIESPLVVRILKLSRECPEDFLKPVSRIAKAPANQRSSPFWQSARGWFGRRQNGGGVFDGGGIFGGKSNATTGERLTR